MLRLFVMAGAVLWLFATEASAATINPHPAVTPYEGSVATRRTDDGFKSYNLVVGVNPDGKTDQDGLRTLPVEGNLIRFAYENPKDKSAHEIHTNYRKGLEAGGFEILFACATVECGPTYATSRWGRVTGLRYTSSDMHYIAARANKNGQDIYVAVLVAKLRHQVEIVEVMEMERGKVTARAISEGLMTDGRVALDGLFFDTDKTTLTPESKPALDEIAAFLSANPELKAYIVGHTDSTGNFGYNMQLSKGRAATVVGALVRDYGIKQDRLAAHGVGPLTPSSTNKNDDGRSVNRRVEMVEM